MVVILDSDAKHPIPPNPPTQPASLRPITSSAVSSRRLPTILSGSSSSSSLSSRNGIQPFLLSSPSSPPPPGYNSRNKPTIPICYAFRPMPHSSMLLIPPESEPDAHEPYFVSVTPNCFTPSSWITTVRRNSMEGEFVGSFEIGPNGQKVPSTVCLRGTEYPLNEALSIHPFRRNSWTWTTFDRDKIITLHWEARGDPAVLTCFRSKDKNQNNQVAKFTPKGTPPREGRAIVYAKLDITPLGHDLFDDVIMSLLIVERLRTTPTT